jgi:hypothetical protein
MDIANRFAGVGVREILVEGGRVSRGTVVAAADGWLRHDPSSGHLLSLDTTVGPRDVTSAVAVNLKRLKQHGKGTRFHVMLWNRGDSPLEGPISLVVVPIPRRHHKQRLLNATGLTQVQPPPGSPYVDVLPGDARLAPGQMLSVLLVVVDALQGRPHFALHVLAGPGPR